MLQPTILAVDDKPLILMNLEDSLSEAGFSVISAANAQEALRQLETRSENIRALVTDVRMPGGLNGWDLARRAREAKPDLIVIYVTGDSAHDWPALGVPGSQVISKPYAFTQLVTALSTLLNESELVRAIARPDGAI